MQGRRFFFGLETATFWALRFYAVPAARRIAAAAGRELYELPVVKTAYIPFGVSILAFVWVKLRGERWADFGLRTIRDWPRFLLATAALIFAVLAYSILLEPSINAWVTRFWGGDPHAAVDTFADVAGNLPLFLFTLPFVWLFAALGEEFFYRGFLMRRVAQMLGEGRAAWSAAVILQAVIFGFAHAYQGPTGIASTMIMGLMYGIGTLLAGRNLWPAIVAHGVIDTLGFTLLYLGLLEA